jgi:hypothetical protein
MDNRILIDFLFENYFYFDFNFYFEKIKKNMEKLLITFFWIIFD